MDRWGLDARRHVHFLVWMLLSEDLAPVGNTEGTWLSCVWIWNSYDLQLQAHSKALFKAAVFNCLFDELVFSWPILGESKNPGRLCLYMDEACNHSMALPIRIHKLDGIYAALHALEFDQQSRRPPEPDFSRSFSAATQCSGVGRGDFNFFFNMENAAHDHPGSCVLYSLGQFPPCTHDCSPSLSNTGSYVQWQILEELYKHFITSFPQVRESSHACETRRSTCHVTARASNVLVWRDALHLNNF